MPSTDMHIIINKINSYKMTFTADTVAGKNLINMLK